MDSNEGSPKAYAELTPVSLETSGGEVMVQCTVNGDLPITVGLLDPRQAPIVNTSNELHVTGLDTEVTDETEYETVEEQTEFQEVYQKLIDLFRELPKEMFVNRVLLNEASCEATLENYRMVPFEELKELDDFPFGLQCELKRRVHTCKGDAVAVKLAYDIHTLMAVHEGGDYSDLKDMFRSNKSSSQ